MTTVYLVQLDIREESPELLNLFKKLKAREISHQTWLVPVASFSPAVSSALFQELLKHLDQRSDGLFVAPVELDPAFVHILNHQALGEWIELVRKPGRRDV